MQQAKKTQLYPCMGPQKSLEIDRKSSPGASKLSQNPSKSPLGTSFFWEGNLREVTSSQKDAPRSLQGLQTSPNPPSKTHQNRGRSPQKSMLKNDSFFAWILDGFGPRFGRIFGWFFGPNMHENCKNTILTKTLKTSLPSRRNAYFQEIEDRTKQKNQAKNNAKLHVF